MDINTVLLPGRAYTTFAKIGRILERMTEDGAYSRWAITFNESSYLGDFYSTFLDHIRRCPQVVYSLSVLQRFIFPLILR